MAFEFGEPSAFRDGPLPTKTSSESPWKFPAESLKLPRISRIPPKSKSTSCRRNWKTGVGWRSILISWPFTTTVSLTIWFVVLMDRPMLAPNEKPPSSAVPELPALPRKTPATPTPGLTTNAP